MSTIPITEPLPEILIPSLPNEIALQCLARVPRQYHPVLAAVSKPIKSLLSSPEFFAARSSLNCTEHLLYLRIQCRYCQPEGWFTVYGRRPNPNSDNNKSNIIIAPVPGDPNDLLAWFDYAVVGPKIYVMGGMRGHRHSTKVWIFDCRFHTWESGPSKPKARWGAAKTIVLDNKIFVIGWSIIDDFWVDVLDTVDGCWEAIPSPKLGAYGGGEILGCANREGKICVWLEWKHEELRLDIATKTWEVFGSGVGLQLDWSTQICEVNGILYCTESTDWTIKGFDETIGVWKKIKLLNKGWLPNNLSNFWMVNVGGRLVFMALGNIWDEAVTSDLEEETGLWCAEIEVNKDEDGDFRGEVLWSEMVSSKRAPKIDRHRAPFVYTCMMVSL